MKISFEPPFTPKNTDFVQFARSKGDENQATVSVMEMRNRQQSLRNGHEKQATMSVISITDTLLPISHVHYGHCCLFLMSITDTLLPISHLHYGHYCLIFISLGPGKLNKIGNFRGEGGLK